MGEGMSKLGNQREVYEIRKKIFMECCMEDRREM